MISTHFLYGVASQSPRILTGPYSAAVIHYFLYDSEMGARIWGMLGI